METVPSTSMTNNSLLNFKVNKNKLLHKLLIKEPFLPCRLSPHMLVGDWDLRAIMESHFSSIRIVLLGEGAVGKTSLMLRYVENKFNPQHVSTLQASFLSKKLHVDGQTVELNIWDTAGQEKFHALGPIYYRDSHGALLVYDVTDAHSFEKVKMWVKELKRILGDDVYLMIIGNKVDLERNRNVDINEATGYAKSIGAEHFETSAKDNIGVTEVFDYLVKDLIERARHSQFRGTDLHYGVSRRNDLLIIDDPPPVKKSCCSG